MVLLVLTLGVADVLMLGVVDGMCGELAFKNMYLYKLTESQTAWINGLLKKGVTAMWTKDELSSKFQLPRADTHTRFILALGMGAIREHSPPK